MAGISFPAAPLPFNEKEIVMCQDNCFNGMDVAIVHYNTPELTAAAIRSLWKCTPGCRVTVLDNSDKRCFQAAGPLGTVNVIDNTKGQVIDFERWLGEFPDKSNGTENGYASAKHCYSVQWLIDHLDRPFILLDSDVLVVRDLRPIWREDLAFVARVSTNTRKYGVEIYRATPFLCFINVPMVKAAGVRYFNPQYMWDLSKQMPNMRYDTGAWFLRDVNAHGLPYQNADTMSMALHLRHGSWGTNDAMEWLKKNEQLHTL